MHGEPPRKSFGASQQQGIVDLPVNLGFNSNVRLGDALYHVQTEDRGAGHPFIDTTVYAQGQVMHRRTSSYQDLLDSPGADEAALKQRVEQQHHSVLEEMHAGKLKFDWPTATKSCPAASFPAGIQVQLLNPASWLAASTASLHIEVRARGSRQPVEDASVEVTLEGARGPARFAARTNAQGYAELIFPLPDLGPDGAALVVHATGTAGEDEIRYQLRPKAGASAPHTPAK